MRLLASLLAAACIASVSPAFAQSNPNFGYQTVLSSAALNSSIGAKIDLSRIGAANGVAALDGTGNVPSSQLGFAGKAAIGANVINAATEGVVCDGSTDNHVAYSTILSLETAGSTVYFPPTTNTITHIGTGWAGSMSGATLTLTAVGSGGLYDGVPLSMSGLQNGVVIVALASGTANTVGATYVTTALAGTSVAAETIASTSVAPCLSSTALSLRSNTALFAYPGTVILEPTAANTASPLVLSLNSVQNVQISGVTVDGDVSGIGNANNVDLVFDSSNVLFNGVTVQNTSGIGIEFSGGTGSVQPGNQNTGVQNSTFVNVGEYVPLAPGTQNRQSIAWSQGTIADNIGNFAKNNSFNGSGLDEISIATQGSFQATGNVLYNSSGGACIYAVGSGDLQIESNRCSGASGNGYDLLTNTSAQVIGNRATLAGGNGFSLVSTNGALEASENYSTDNDQKAQANIAGFVVGGTNGSVTLMADHAFDDQGSHTQEYGIYGSAGTTYSSLLWVDQSNDFSQGNIGGPFGGTISGYTAQKLSATVTSIVQTGSGANIGAYIPVTGTGGFALNSNPEGTNAVDLQSSRNSTSQVANAPNGTLVGGANNTVASGAQFGTIVGSQGSQVSGQYSSLVGGQFGFDKARTGYVVFPSADFFAGVGDRQASQITLGAITTSATPVRLDTTNNTGSIGGCQNSLLMVASQIYSGHGWVVAFEPTTLDWAEWDYLSLAVLRGTTAAATTLPVGTYESAAGVLTTPISTTMAPTFGTTTGKTWSLSITSDTTNGCLNATVTGAASATIHTEMHLDGMDGG